MEPIVPSSDSRAEQIGHLCAIWELLCFIAKNVFLLITRERVFYKKNYGPKWSFSVKVESFAPRSEFRAEQFSSYVRFRDYYILFLKMCFF